MEKCVETQGTVDMQTDGMQVWVCGEVAQAVRSLGIRVCHSGVGYLGESVQLGNVEEKENGEEDFVGHLLDHRVARHGQRDGHGR